MKHEVYLGLGSNLGDKRAHLEHALWHLPTAELHVVQVSSVYHSAPVGPCQDQPAFENAVVHVETDLPPRQLLARCLKVEQELGRVRSVDKGPRCIDIDLLLVDDLVASWPELELPHPALTQRAFVLAPLAEIAPLLTDPRDGALLCCKLGALLRSQSILRVGRLERCGPRAAAAGGGAA